MSDACVTCHGQSLGVLGTAEGSRVWKGYGVSAMDQLLVQWSIALRLSMVQQDFRRKTSRKRTAFAAMCLEEEEECRS